MKRLLVAIGVLAGVIVASANPAGALAPTAVAWWWSAQQTPAPLPAPPTVPADGLMVGADPSDANAVAALRFAVPSDQISPILTLTVADNGDVNGSGAAMSAYGAARPWTPVYAGEWAAKPTFNPTPAVRGIRSADGKQWTFDLSPLLSNGVIDVVLFPDKGSNFELSFNGPTESALKTSPKPQAFAPDSSADFAPDAVADTAPAITDFSAPLDVPAYSAPTEEVALTAAPAGGPVRAAPAVALAPKRNRAAGIAFLLLVGAALAAYALNQIPTPAVRGLGPMTGTGTPVVAVIRRRKDGPTEPQVGGLGRFARTRYGPPPKL